MNKTPQNTSTSRSTKPRVAHKGIIGIPDELIPSEGLPVATDEQIADAFRQGEIGKLTLPMRIIENK